MNILYVLSHINKSLQWEWFAEEMKNRGAEQTYIIIDDGILKSSCLHTELLKMGITSYFLQRHSKLSHFTNLAKTISIIRNVKPDIIHTSLPYGNAIGQMAALVTGIKYRISKIKARSLLITLLIRSAKKLLPLLILRENILKIIFI
jgi:hypothetical protein